MWILEKFNRKEKNFMCKVLTQDKLRLIDVSNMGIFIEENEEGDGFNISILGLFNRSVILGTYRTEEYAKKILELMAICLGTNGYYKMPEIDSKSE